MDHIIRYLLVATMFGVIHAFSFLAAYDIDRKYRKMTYRFKRTEESGIKRILTIPKKSPFLLTVDGELWSIATYAVNVLLFILGDCLIRNLTDLNEKSRFLILWSILAGMMCLLSFWMHRAADTVIKLSKTKVVSDADFEHHVKGKLREARKAYPAPRYSCEMTAVKEQKVFWTHEVWIVVARNETGELVLEESVAKRDWYRYYDGAVIQLLGRFERIGKPAC